MAIRVVNKVGVADTQAELLLAASEYDSNTVVYCVDTGNTFTRISNIWTNGNYIGVEDDITVVDGVTEYFIDTANAGQDITITLPNNLTEGITFTFKRADSSASLYSIFFNIVTYTLDVTNPSGNYELLPSENNYISLTRFNANWNIVNNKEASGGGGGGINDAYFPNGWN